MGNINLKTFLREGPQIFVLHTGCSLLNRDKRETENTTLEISNAQVLLICIANYARVF